MGRKKTKKTTTTTAAAAPAAAPAAAEAPQDDEWALLEQAAAEAQAEAQAVAPPPAPEPEPAPAAADDEGEAEADGQADGQADSKKKKKKKKKAGAKGAGGAKTSGAAKILLERRRALEEQQAREDAERKAFEDAENARLAAIAEAKAAKEAEAAAKAEARRLKKEKAKAEGRYKTKAQKERERRAEAARAALAASGVEVPASGAAAGPKRPSARDQRKKKAEQQRKAEEAAAAAAAAAEAEAAAAAAAAEAEAKSDDDDGLDDWENEDWESVDVDAVVPVAAEPEPEPEAAGEEDEDEALREQRLEAERLRQAGLAAQEREREREQRQAAAMEQAVDDSDDEDTMEEGSRAEQEALMRKLESRRRRQKRHADAVAARSPDSLRSPLTVIMGHVDTGKTKLLDKIRRTNVQEGEAGGITQQIGATFFPRDSIAQKTARLNQTEGVDMRLPGLLVIDTPGHEAFSNLRSRGSTLCDFAILVIDIMHGLEPQTIESLNLLRESRAPFVVALNKVDRLYDWQVCADAPIREALAAQPEHVQAEFDDRVSRAILELNEQGLNAALYWDNDEPRTTISIIPTSAHSGEGVPDLLLMQFKLMQSMMLQKLMFVDSVQCSVLEVKAIEGLGTTVDVVLVNGTLREGDTLVACTLDGPVVTQVRALLTPHPMREMRVKGDYIHHQEIRGSMGIKICAHGLERAMAGCALLVQQPGDDVEDLKEEVMQDLEAQLAALATEPRGVFVQADTLGALEALLVFLRTEKIPVAGVAIGPVHKKDVMRASAMLEHRDEYASILAFAVRVDAEATELAAELGVHVFTNETVYRLAGNFKDFLQERKQQLQERLSDVAVFPCILRILPQHIFNKRDPIVLGVDVVDGICRVGTPLVIPNHNMLEVGVVTGVQNNHKEVEEATKGQSVCIKINTSETSVVYGRHFTNESGDLMGHLTRESIDALKEGWGLDDLSRDVWKLIVRQKPLFNIM